MTNLPRRRLLSLALVGGLASAGVTRELFPRRPAFASKDAALVPATIPALQQWTPSAIGGTYEFRPGARILLSGADARALRTTAEVLADDLERVTGIAVPVVTETYPTARPGDVRLTLVRRRPPHGTEGYELAVGTSLEVRGAQAGVFHGGRTIVQWLRQTRTVPAGIAKDWPRYPERGLLVANGPKRFSTQWWEGQIRELSYLKLNLLWLYVGYATATLAEMQAITAFAARYNVQVVPQHNMPDHMGLLLVDHPELQLPGRPQSLDLSNPAAYEYAKDVTSPLLDQFPTTPHWHLGSDEYLLGSSYDNYPQLLAYARERFGPHAVPPDVHYGFINDLNATVRAAGKTMRVWNDGIFTNATVPIDTDVVIEHWTQWENRKTPRQLVDEGYRLANSNQDYLYYDPGNRHPDPARIYDEFHVGLFQAGETVPDDHPALLGAKIHLWTLPDVESEEFESDTMAPALRSLAQVLWGSKKPSATYAGGFGATVEALGRAPGFPVLRHRPFPVDGTTSVAPTRPITVTFYDEVVPGSIELTVGDGAEGTTTYDDATRTATFQATKPLGWFTTYPVELRAEDPHGNRLDPPPQWEFRTAKEPTTGYPTSIWQDTDAPPVDSFIEGQPLELGVKFRTDVPGDVLGIRYYKGARNIGRHDATLWNGNGSKLAAARFADESTAGWQEVRFASPVRIEAGTTYVASYTTPLGVYAATNEVFAQAGKDNGVLHALRDGVDGGNGVFRYGPGQFPNESYRASSYWVDVVFAAT